MSHTLALKPAIMSVMLPSPADTQGEGNYIPPFEGDRVMDLCTYFKTTGTSDTSPQSAPLENITGSEESY